MKNGVIFCGKRTGSTFLQEALNSHPQIVCYDEMFMLSRKIRKGKTAKSHEYASAAAQTNR